MNWKLFFITFGSIFLAELGDKTQLATISFTADNAKYKWLVFFAAAAALTLTSFLGVFFGHLITKFISPKTIKYAAGILFVGIGFFMLLNAHLESRASDAIEKLNSRIIEIQKIEKCRMCKKFNNLLTENKDKINKNIYIENENLHNEFYCNNCSADELKKIF